MLREYFPRFINSLTEEEKKEIMDSSKEYIHFELFGVGGYTMEFTNDVDFEEMEEEYDVICCTEEVQNIISEEV